MNPLYSVLLCNQSYDSFRERISAWLHAGIKGLWFGTSADLLLKEFHPFAEGFLLQAFQTDVPESALVVDGAGCEHILSVLEEHCPLFNAAQYRVEHCAPERHIVVQASAGTGKTTVMIDRILFLLHTKPELSPSDIYMITFTNEAARQMNLRLQDVLMRRFRLTGQPRYFRWLEEQSQMHISTIHSFAYEMLKEFGIGESFTQDLTIRSFRREQQELIRDLVEKRVDPEYSIQSQVGLPLYRAHSVLEKYWNGFASLGLSRKELGQMNWGSAADGAPAAFHKLISESVADLDAAYLEVKRKSDAISVSDILHDLREVLEGEQLPQPDLQMRYLFIDEFQDSDLSQIRVAVLMVKLLGARLFVVGDVKQSIYRFRGATDQAFRILRQTLERSGEEEPASFILINNYRTAAGIMDRMNLFFKCWGGLGLLQYDGPVVPFNTTEGLMRLIPGSKNRDEEDAVIADTAREQLDSLIRRIEASGRIPSERDRVVMLVRTNKELKTLSSLLRRERIPVTVRTDRPFFTSAAVRDFFTLITSYMFADEPKYIFNYLLSPYAGDLGEDLDIHTMELFGGDYDRLVAYLGHFLSKTSWERRYRDFRLRPVMAVIKSLLDEEPVVETFIKNEKRRRIDEGWEEKRIAAVVRTEAVRYRADLEKLLELLQRTFGSSRVTLYEIYHFLELQIAANRTETEPDAKASDGYRSILCMTVHKAKGLEFDTVILPYTHRRFPGQATTEILIDPTSGEIGWNYGTKSPGEMKNSLYVKLKGEDIARTREEETRILYVAMTRAVNRLLCIVHPPKDRERWAYLLEKGEDYDA